MSTIHVSPPEPHAFNTQVWDIVRQVPPGKVATYGQIAGLILPPEGMDEKAYLVLGPRWVGTAMAASPEGVPWHRVINAQGKISLRPNSGSLIQRELLEAEGIVFDSHDRIDLKRFRWAGLEHPPMDKTRSIQRSLWD